MQKQDGINIIIQQKVRTIETPSKKYGRTIVLHRLLFQMGAKNAKPERT